MCNNSAMCWDPLTDHISTGVAINLYFALKQQHTVPIEHEAYTEGKALGKSVKNITRVHAQCMHVCVYELLQYLSSMHRYRFYMAPKRRALSVATH